MQDFFSSAFFAGNRARLRQLFTGTAPIVITANGILQRSGDNTYPFQQDPSFWYLTGLNDPNLILVMDKDKEYLILPDREEIYEIFDGELEAEDLSRRSGIETIVREKDGWQQLEKRLKRTKYVATLASPPEYFESWGMYTNPARARLIRRVKEANGELELLDLRTHLMKMRMVKQPEEIVAIQAAIDITASTIKEATAPKNLDKYGYEYELEAAITAGFRRRGAEGHGFSPIIAGGKRACTIHYMDNNQPLVSNELVLLDVGAQVGAYTADISRTVIKGQATKRQRAVYDVVREVQEFEIGLLKPGVDFVSCEHEARQFYGEKLRELGLIKTIDEKSIHKYWPHASHYLGLDVHDAGDYKTSMAPGMVVTVEPGLYIPEEGIGVRIEDDVLITETGAKVMSAHLSRELA